MNTSTCTLELLPEQRSTTVPLGTTLQDALAKLDIRVTAPCGGEGTCGKCRVVIEGGNISPLAATERALLSQDQLDQQLRLSCQARLEGDATVVLPATSRAAPMRILPSGTGRSVPIDPAVYKQVVQLSPQSLDESYARLEHLRRCGDLRADLDAELELLRRLPAVLDGEEGEVTATIRDHLLLDVERGDTANRCFGLALDLGTTTVVASLVELARGRERGLAATTNRQTAIGSDVITRINTSLETGDGLEQLRQEALASIEETIDQVLERAEVQRQEVYEATLVGNAAMIHLCLGISPASLGQLPYVGIVGQALEMPAAQLGLQLHRAARVYVLPGIAGFVGADTIAAVLAAGLDEDDGRIRLLADIGTNCELVLRLGQRLIATSTPAGPAFEGARITCGMYAETGAIEAISCNGDFHYSVIGGGAPLGLCGSGLVDAGAELLRQGLVDQTGRLLEVDELDPKVNQALRQRLGQLDGEAVFALAETADGAPVVLSQRDIRELQLAKAAICTGIEILLDKAQLKIDEVDELCLAGGFGNYINKDNARRLGLIPQLPLDKIRFIGNGALVGARLALVSCGLRRRGDQIARQAEHLQLAGTPDFQQRFSDALLFD